jgi:flagellar motor switch protein FliM
MPVEVVLGSADLKLGEILNLSVGDIIQLDNAVNAALAVKVAHKPQFWGKVGRSNKHMAVQVSGVIRDAAPSEMDI